MSVAAWPLQVAVVARLNEALADAGPDGAAVPVLQTVRQGQKRPYVVVGEGIAVPWDTLSRRGEEVAFTLHAWSEQGSFAELAKILARITGALNGCDLALGDGLRLVSLRFVSSQKFTDPGEAQLKHGVIRFRALAG